MKKSLFALLAMFWAFGATAQDADYSKMSSMIRRLTLEQRAEMRRAPGRHGGEVCAFVRIDGRQTLGDDGRQVLVDLGCQPLAQFGDIFIASIPKRRLGALSLHPSVMRIEARQGNSIHMDTTTVLMGGARAHQGDALPQAFTGRGVVVGVEDIGFDLTHPNFYDASLSEYRIKRFWDFLAIDTLDRNLYVGADYTTEQAIKACAHSRDADIISHGTHTLGSAAGSGYDTAYRGMAPCSDICIVSNAVSEDVALIDSADIDKFTYATDALGFKYIFDYADSVGKPCVVSFSEGSAMDFRGDDVLFYSVLDSLTGPGHILVASAGNDGQQTTHVRKPADMERATVAIMSNGSAAYFSARGATDDYKLLLTLPGDDGQTEYSTLSVEAIYAMADSLLTDTLMVGTKPYYITVTCYPSCFDDSQNVMEVVLQTDKRLGLDYYTSVDLIGLGCEVELFRGSGYLVPAISSLGDHDYSIHSPGSAPSVVCVGATGYRTGFVNYLGEYCEYAMGTSGERSAYSSVGPTYDGRIKPDVMAPGTNVISSYSSYYLEARPDASDIRSDVVHFDFQGRTYAWNANSGTSMATPIVAGAIALWLEAKPDLAPEDVMEVIAATSRRHDPSLSYPNNLYGYGEIDAYGGLLYLLGISHVEGLDTRQPSAVSFAIQGDKLTVILPENVDVPVGVRIYAVSGSLLRQVNLKPVGGCFALSLSDLPHGVYAVQVDGPDVPTTGSTLIRK